MPIPSLGSLTAKNGFKNERDIVDKFNSWKTDDEARTWLTIMGYDLGVIEFVKAVIIHGHKTDVQAQVTVKMKAAIDVQNIQVKLVSSRRGFNQIDKRWVDKYKDMWEMPENIVSILKRYCGELPPTAAKTKYEGRMLMHEFAKEESDSLFKWLCDNKSLIVSDILKGRGQFAAEWMLVAHSYKDIFRWVLKPMNVCLNLFGNGEVIFRKTGNIRIANIGLQRKGGDGGADSANMMQFKLDPIKLFDLV